MVEDEAHHIVLINTMFCGMFRLPALPELLIGMDCSDAKENIKEMFNEPSQFKGSLDAASLGRGMLKGLEFGLQDGRTLALDYIPIYSGNIYKGQLWKFEDITTKKQTESNLLRLSQVASSNENGIIFINRSGRISWANEAFCRLSGYSREEADGAKPISLCAGSLTGRQELKTLMECFSEGKNFDLEMVYYRKDGTYFWSRIRGQMILDEKGDSSLYFAMVEDISAEKQTREQLELLSLIARKTFTGVFITGSDNTIVWVNEAMENMQGYASTELLGKTPAIFTGVATNQLTHANLVAQVAKQEVFKTEIILYKKSGESFWAELNGQPIYDADDNYKGYIVMQADISARKSVTESVRRRKEKYRGIISNMHLGLLELDQAERIQVANQSFCDMSGYEMEELTGNISLAGIFGKIDTTLKDIKTALLTHGTSGSFEIQVYNKQGEERWWLMSTAPKYTENNIPDGSIGIFLDISNHKKLEQDLIKAKQVAEESSKSKQHFLGNMSHEIRTPMNAVLGMTNLLGKTNLNEKQSFYLDNIQSASENLLVIINDILDLSKIEAGKVNLEKISFEPSAILHKSIQVLKHRADEKNIVLKIGECDEQLAAVLIGDPFRTQQILLNLLSNAVKFTDTGSVTVSCKVLTDTVSSQLLQFTVIDTGMGMDVEFVKNIFAKFSQEYDSGKRLHGGTGLGMSICKELVELMKGTISVESRKGIGTNVTISIPFEKGDPVALPDAEKIHTDASLLKGRRVLIVDDNEMNRLVASTILELYGIIISEAENGQEAVAAIRANQPDLVLMDIQMPVMSGFEATRVIRSEISQTLPVIALTANAIKGENQKCFEQGMNDFISKPFKENDLVSMLLKWLAK
jgi:PAS domain S-box-containing protein